MKKNIEKLWIVQRSIWIFGINLLFLDANKRQKEVKIMMLASAKPGVRKEVFSEIVSFNNYKEY